MNSLSLRGARMTLLPILVALLSFCSCQAPRDLETLFLPTRETWIEAFTNDDGHQTIVECVRPGETIDTWRELITVQSLDDRMPRREPLAVMKELEQQMRTHGGELDWKVIEQDAGSVLYEWTLSGAKGIEPQGELVRLVQGNEAMHRAAFAYKGLPLAPERRKQMLDLLSKAQVIKGESGYRAAVAEMQAQPQP